MTGNILICLTLFFVPVELRKLCPKSVPNPIRIKDPDDCTKYHLCVDMREFIITCPDHFVVSERSMKCVPEGSVFDTCEQIYLIWFQLFSPKQYELHFGDLVKSRIFDPRRPWIAKMHFRVKQIFIVKLKFSLCVSETISLNHIVLM